VVKEIEHCIFKFNTNSFQFFDDNFTLKKSRVMEICRLLKEKKLNIRFLMISRVDLFLDEEMVQALSEVGCECVSFGVESGDQFILNKMKKGITTEQAKKAFDLCKKYKIDVVAYFIIGHPEETYNSIENTINFIKKTELDWFKANILIPYPGSFLYETLLREGKIADFWKDMTLTGKPPVIPNICKNFTRKELEKFRNKINFMPYFRKKSNLFHFKKLKSLSNAIWSLRWASRALLNRLSL